MGNGMGRMCKRTRRPVTVTLIPKGQNVLTPHLQGYIRADDPRPDGTYPKVDGFEVSDEDGRVLAAVNKEALERRFPVDLLAEVRRLRQRTEKLEKRKQ